MDGGLRKVWDGVRQRGLLGALRHYAGRALDKLRSLSPAQRRWQQRLAEFDREFDSTRGVDTGGIIPPNRLSVTSDSLSFAVAYVASPPDEFRRTLEGVRLDHRQFVFIDFGSGKGRAVLLAAHYPFKKVIGVEFSPLLHKIAEHNVAVYRGEQKCRNIQLVCADAMAFPPPDEPLACYFYNPFERQVMKAVVANLRESFERHPRPVYLFYCNPVLEDVLAQEPSLEKAAAGDLFVVYRFRTP